MHLPLTRQNVELWLTWLAMALLAMVLPACAWPQPSAPEASPSAVAIGAGQHIIVCGQRVQVDAPVVLWTDVGGMNAYATRPESPANHGQRRHRDKAVLPLDAGLPVLQSLVDQLVIHYDGSGTSRRCFATLTSRNLSAHFLIDVDGTIYQTLDLQHRAFHATIANDRSIGVELANVGAYPRGEQSRLSWYRSEPDGAVRFIPPWPGEDWRLKEYQARPIRPYLIDGWIQGQRLVQYDFTARQYESLARLTAALCRLFPLLLCDYPRDSSGQLVREQLPAAGWETYRGLLGHYHIQSNKVDPGPAFDWDRFVGDARQRMRWVR